MKDLFAPVYIMDAKRTPTAKNAFKDISPIALGAATVKSLLLGIGAFFKDIDGVYMGSVYQAKLGQSPAKQVGVHAGIDPQFDAATINKVCSSGLAAMKYGCYEILLGDMHLVVAGGMESMSRAPYMMEDGLTDAYEETHPTMIELSERFARRFGISRFEQDIFAFNSYNNAGNAREKIKKHIVSIETKTGLRDFDEGWRYPDFAKMQSLLTILPQGTITAANASQVADGASAVALASWEKAGEFRRNNVYPLARILGFASHSCGVADYPIAPVGAIRKLLERFSLNLKTIDLFEINEATAVVPILAAKQIGIPLSKINIWGGAIATGHPLGASGAKIVAALCYALRDIQGKYGIAVTCNGGGEALAVLIENIAT